MKKITEFLKKRRKANYGLISLLLFDTIYLILTGNLQLFHYGRWNEVKILFLNQSTFFSILNSWVFFTLIVAYIYPGAPKKILEKLNEILKRLKQSEVRDKDFVERLDRIEQNSRKQGKDHTQEELLKEIEELKSKLPKGIDEELEDKIENLFDELKFEEIRNLVDEFIEKNENIKQKDLAKLHLQKALTYNAENDYRSENKELTIALELDKSNAEIQKQFGFHSLILAKPKEAIQYFNNVLQLNIEKFGNNHPEVIRTINNIGLALYFDGEIDEAFKFFKKILKIFKTKFIDNYDIAFTYKNIGLIWQDKGDNHKALDYYKKSLEILKIELLDEDNIEIAQSYYNIGNIYLKKGDNDKALFYLEKSLVINRKLKQENDPNTAKLYSAIGSVYQLKREFNSALKYFTRSLKINKNIFGKNHIKTANDYDIIGMLYFTKGDSKNSIIYFIKALNVYKLKLGDDHEDFARLYNHLASAWYQSGENDKALEFYDKTLKILYNLYPKTHPIINLTLNNIKIIKQKIT